MAAGRAPKPADRTRLAGAYIGSVIGAGFASGQEHAAFFLRFGEKGLLGLGVAGLMFAGFGALLLALSHRYRTRSHTQLLHMIAPLPVAALFDALLSSFALISLSVMMAGTGALLHTLTGAPALFGAIAMAGTTLALLLLRIDRMLQINAVITAALILLLLSVGLGSLPNAMVKGIGSHAGGASWVPDNWPLAAVLYGSYNLALTIAVFGALGREIQDVREAVAAGIGGGIVLTLLSAGVFVAVASVLPEAGALEIPVLLAAGRLGRAAHFAYIAAVGLAMLTTAVASAYALTRRLSHCVGGSTRLSAVLVTGAALPLSFLGFGRLVVTLYPLIGYVGAGCLVLAALRPLRGPGDKR